MIATIGKTVALGAALVTLAVPAVAFASLTPNLTQTINTGTSSAEILDSTRTPVGSPAFAFTTSAFSFNCQTITGQLGDNNQRIYVSAFGDHPNGFNVTMAATSGATTTWSAGTPKYDYNDASGSGCTDGGDADSYGGQLTVNPSAGTITADYASGTTTGVTKGSSTAFVEGTTNSVTLFSAGNTASATGRWYLTGASLSQTVPAEQATGSYTLGMTLTYAGL